jgi:hypothetical protein
MAIASKDTFLLDGGAASGSASWSAGLLQINSYSDPEGDMETGETTHLGSGMRTSIPTVRSESAWVFEANFAASALTTLKALEGTEKHYAIWHGGTLAAPTGANGKHSVTGYLTAREKGAGVGDIVKMEIKITHTSAPVFSAS